MKEGKVLKVDSFLNHQMDIGLFNEMGKEWKKRFEGKKINKILTIEASGIGIAVEKGFQTGGSNMFGEENLKVRYFIDESVYDIDHYYIAEKPKVYKRAGDTKIYDRNEFIFSKNERREKITFFKRLFITHQYKLCVPM